MKKYLWKVLLVLTLLVAVLAVPAAAETLEYAGENTFDNAFDFNMAIDGVQNYDEMLVILEKTNQYRAEVGAAALRLDPQLTEMAMQRAAEIAVHYSHNRPDNTTCYTVMDGTVFASGYRGENIAVGQNSGESVSVAWYNSQGHYENMINSRYKSIGIGCFTHAGRNHWVQLFSDKTTGNSKSYSGYQMVYDVPVRVNTANIGFILDAVNDCGVLELYEKQSVTPVASVVNKALSNAGFYRAYTRLSDSCYSFGSANTAVATASGRTITGVSAGTTITPMYVSNLQLEVTTQVYPRPVLSYVLDSEGYPTIRWEDELGEATLFFKEQNDDLWTSTGYSNGSYYHSYCEEGDVYTYVLRISTNGEYQNVSDPITVTIGGEPAAPEISAATVKTSGKIKLSWSAVKKAAEYKVYRATSKTGTYKLVATTSGTSYTDTAAKAATKYYYKVKSVSAGGATSGYSNLAAATCDLARPDVTASNIASSGKVKLTWKAVEGATKYEIYRSTQESSGFKKLNTVTGTTYSNISVDAGKTYYYRVKALCSVSAATSAYSLADKITVDLARPDVTATNIASSGKVKLTWKAVEGATKYEIYRSTKSDSGFKKLNTVTGTTYSNLSVDAGKTYYYRVKALCGVSAATSAYSLADKITVDLARPDVTATNIKASGKVKLSWKAVEGATKYEIYRSTKSDSGFKKLNTVTGTTYSNISVDAGKTYYYRVKALCGVSAATSAYSLADKITVDLARPDVTVSLKSGKPYLKWPAVEDATKYEIYRSTSQDGKYTKLNTITGTSYRNASAAAGKTYYYRVRAICSVSAAASAYDTVSIKSK